MADPRFEGLSIPDPGFPGDVGVADPGVLDAMDHYRAGEMSLLALIERLQGTRLLVPVVAVLDSLSTDDEAEGHGHGHVVEKDSHMAAVSMINPDGRRGLLAFTGVESLNHWDAAARPVPVTFEAALEAARSDGADALVLDATTRLVAIPVALPTPPFSR